MTTTRNRQSWLTWAGDIFLLDAYKSLLTEGGQKKFHQGLGLAAAQGALEGAGLFAVIPTITAFVTDAPSMGLTWGGWVVVLIVLAVAGIVLTYFQTTIAYMAAMDLLRHLSVRIGDHVSRLPLGWFKAGFAGRLSRLLTQSLMHVGEGLAHFTTPLVRGVSMSVVMMLLAWTWSWQLGLSLLLALPIMYLLTLASRALKARGEEIAAVTESELASRIVEFCESQPALRAAGRAGHYAPLAEARAANQRANHKNLWFGLFGNLIGGMGVQAITVVLIVLATRLGDAGTLDPVATIAFIGVSLRYTKVLEDILSSMLAIEFARKPISDFQDILDAPVLPEASQPAELDAPGTVTFEDVSFGYTPDKPVLSGVSFTAPTGSLTAIVGPSGSGKTTLFRLAARFWDVSAGRVLVGGADVRDQPTEQLMEQLAMVFQDVYLYDSTLADNIRVGREDATDDEVRAAGALAGVDEIAARLPGGWQASVGEGGKRLSGGERQRVSVARALLKRAPILLFDEATSALDPENEAQVARAIDDLRATSTVLVIAHKLATIRSADQIVVLGHDGTIAQVGTHDELLAAGGVYADLWAAREKAQGWSLVTRR